MLATSQLRVAIKLAIDELPPMKLAVTELPAFWYSAGMLPAAIHGMEAPTTGDTVNAGTLPGSATVRLAGGAEPT